ncbi:hypothetical protein HK098_003283 [Nowakowskiella sp. JEL0407]|nr:hypothetical protein HK098_003283 [Nowakowskiella sp. JEL0407]
MTSYTPASSQQQLIPYSFSDNDLLSVKLPSEKGGESRDDFQISYYPTVEYQYSDYEYEDVYEEGVVPEEEEDGTHDYVREVSFEDIVENEHEDEYEDISFEEEDDEMKEEIEVTYAPRKSISRPRRGSVSAESLAPSLDRNYAKKIIQKSASQRARIESAILPSFLFRDLDQLQQTDIINSMEEHTVTAGTVVIKQGDIGDYFYIVESGEFDVYIDKRIVANASLNGLEYQSSSLMEGYGSEEDESGFYGKKVNEHGPGASFGELALMYNAPRAATVVCREDAVLWALDRVTFRRLLIENMSRKTRLYGVLAEHEEY